MSSVPIFCLVDADPAGLKIFTTYRDGSAQMSFDVENLRADRLEWLGVTVADMHRWASGDLLRR
jgi:meiotic recombination protein SPO11